MGAGDKSIPATAGVIGGGRMGSGIAQVLAEAGAQVMLVDDGAEAAAAARERVANGLGKAAERGKLGEGPEVVLRRVTAAGSISELPASAELVVEAVPESVSVKVDVLTRAEHVAGRDAVLASNTSSLPIGELAAALQNPDRFCGMHFFNPVPVSQLVEVIIGAQTDAQVRDRVVAWVRGLGKTEVVVRDSPGFATSRLGVALGLEAIRMLEEGVADADAIDTAMELGYRHPMGPLRSTDLVGLDVRLAIAEHLRASLGERFVPPALLREKVDWGELGRKSGRGFHEWS